MAAIFSLVGGAHPTIVKQSLGIIGASTRAAAASAVRAGFQPLAADLFADADLRRIATATRISPYPEGFVDWLRVVEPPAWMYTGALENHPELVDQLAWIAPLWGNSGDVLTRVRSPWELARALENAGLLFPETRKSAKGLPHNGNWLVKTYRGASGSGVRPLELAIPFGEASDEVYQQTIAGLPCAAVYVATSGAAKLLGITRQFIGEVWLGAHGYQYAGSIGPWTVSYTAENTLERIGDVLAEEFELTGLFGVDFILDGEQVWTVEVNPRYTASVEIVERFSGTSAIEAHVAACGGSSTTKPADRFFAPTEGVVPAATGTDATSHSRLHAKAILFARRDFVITQSFADDAHSEALRTPWPTLADVSPAGTPIDKGRPILTIFAAGATPAGVERQLRDRVVEIEDKLYID
jgi:predicted ATP-grasp superfamily ATP-dependent carboligase